MDSVVVRKCPEYPFPMEAQKYEPGHSISYKTACAPSENLDQPAHPCSLIRVFAVHMYTRWILGYP